jgi:hypothetical protein
LNGTPVNVFHRGAVVIIGSMEEGGMSEIHTPDEVYIPYVPHDPSLGDPSKDWMAIVSLVSGIIGLCVGIFFVFCGLPLSIASIILGVLGLKSTQRVLAIIGISLGGLILLWSLIAVLCLGGALGMGMLEGVTTY